MSGPVVYSDQFTAASYDVVVAAIITAFAVLAAAVLLVTPGVKCSSRVSMGEGGEESKRLAGRPGARTHHTLTTHTHTQNAHTHIFLPPPLPPHASIARSFFFSTATLLFVPFPVAGRVCVPCVDTHILACLFVRLRTLALLEGCWTSLSRRFQSFCWCYNSW